MAVVLFYAGLLAVLAGVVSARADGVLAGAGTAVAAALLPARQRRSATQLGIDRLMPEFHFHERHALRVRGTAASILAAVKAVTPAEIRFLRVLAFLRTLPARIVARPTPEPGWDRPMLHDFAPLAEAPRELVYGLVGRFWRVAGGRVPVDGVEGFLAFDEPGHAKATVAFLVADERDGWRTLTTETRVFVPEPSARRRFAAYWRVIYPGSSLIRWAWLRAIRRRVGATSRPGSAA